VDRSLGVLLLVGTARRFPIVSELEDIPSEFYEMTGRITCDWAILEILVNDCIWALSGIHYGAGACITSQIYTFDARMKGLIALLNLRKENDFAKKVNLFWEGSRKASETRNRVAHDLFFLKRVRHGNFPLLQISY
jgi:hypothetical protein